MNIESIGEVKILTQGYQAEYGRASGLQITAVTKSGTNRYRGSAYSVFTELRLERDRPGCARRTAIRRRTPNRKRSATRSADPIGKPGGSNKLFFFYAHEYRPTTAAINNGNVIRLRVPTALERAGDFSQSLDNNGDLIPQLLRRGEQPERSTTGPDPGQPPLQHRHQHPESLPAAERHAGPGHELQLRSAAADHGRPHSAAGRPPRLPDVAEAAVHRQVLRRPARASS